MVLSRAATLPKGIARSVWRRAGSSSRNGSWKQVGRRGYASDHGHGQQQGSEIPWIIGSAAVTIPAAGWLWQQGPKKSEHGHGHDAHHDKQEEEAEPKEEEEPQAEEESKEEEPKEESKDEDKDEDESEDKKEEKDDGKDGEEKDESKDGEEKDESGDDKAEGDSKDSGKDGEDDGPSAGAPKQINWDSSSSKGPGEGQKGDRKASEKKGEKDSQGDKSGAKHPYLDDPEKSKKGQGVTDTAKIHGTVDTSQGSRGVKGSGSSSS